MRHNLLTNVDFSFFCVGIMMKSLLLLLVVVVADKYLVRKDPSLVHISRPRKSEHGVTCVFV